MSGRARVLIPVGFGLNCEDETTAMVRMAGAEADCVHWTDLFTHTHSKRITDYQVLIFLGGFAYGDHVAGGLVLAARIRVHLQEGLRAFLENGGRILGVCNGFQTLVRLGLLPGPEEGPADFVPRVALANNDRLGYRNAWVKLAADPRSPCLWTRGLRSLDVPARHGEGKVVMESAAALTRLESRGQVALRYLGPDGAPTETWPHNPNGSAGGIAGICDSTGRILGLMPHPEAFLYPWQHPDWPRCKSEIEKQEPTGLAILRNGIAQL